MSRPPRGWVLPGPHGAPPPPPPRSLAGIVRRLARGHADAVRALALRGLATPRLLPQFLGIGAQKAGTTWLHSNLARHPQLFLPAAKELHWFDWNWHRSPAAYAHWFRDAGTRMRGEITPAYAILPAAQIAMATQLMPQVRLIFLLRDPIERAWSQAQMNLVRHGGRAAESIADAEWREHLSSHAVIERSRYCATLDRWGRQVPTSRILTAFFEEISVDPGALLRRTCAFLGVDPHHEALRTAAGGVVNAGAGLAMPEIARRVLVGHLGAELIELERRFGGPAAAWRRRWLG